MVESYLHTPGWTGMKSYSAAAFMLFKIHSSRLIISYSLFSSYNCQEIYLEVTVIQTCKISTEYTEFLLFLFSHWCLCCLSQTFAIKPVVTPPQGPIFSSHRAWSHCRDEYLEFMRLESFWEEPRVVPPIQIPGGAGKSLWMRIFSSCPHSQGSKGDWDPEYPWNPCLHPIFPTKTGTKCHKTFGSVNNSHRNSH